MVAEGSSILIMMASFRSIMREPLRGLAARSGSQIVAQQILLVLGIVLLSLGAIAFLAALTTAVVRSQYAHIVIPVIIAAFALSVLVAMAIGVTVLQALGVGFVLVLVIALFIFLSES
jgi:hypothetical protein